MSVSLMLSKPTTAMAASDETSENVLQGLQALTEAGIIKTALEKSQYLFFLRNNYRDAPWAALTLVWLNKVGLLKEGRKLSGYAVKNARWLVEIFNTLSFANLFTKENALRILQHLTDVHVNSGGKSDLLCVHFALSILAGDGNIPCRKTIKLLTQENFELFLKNTKETTENLAELEDVKCGSQSQAIEEVLSSFCNIPHWMARFEMDLFSGDNAQSNYKLVVENLNKIRYAFGFNYVIRQLLILGVIDNNKQLQIYFDRLIKDAKYLHTLKRAHESLLAISKLFVKTNVRARDNFEHLLQQAKHAEKIYQILGVFKKNKVISDIDEQQCFDLLIKHSAMLDVLALVANSLIFMGNQAQYNYERLLACGKDVDSITKAMNIFCVHFRLIYGKDKQQVIFDLFMRNAPYAEEIAELFKTLYEFNGPTEDEVKLYISLSASTKITPADIFNLMKIIAQSSIELTPENRVLIFQSQSPISDLRATITFFINYNFLTQDILNYIFQNPLAGKEMKVLLSSMYNNDQNIWADYRDILQANFLRLMQFPSQFNSIAMQFYEHICEKPQKAPAIIFDEILKKIEKELHNTQRVVTLVSFFRANSNNDIRNSILPLTNTISELTGMKRLSRKRKACE